MTQKERKTAEKLGLIYPDVEKLKISHDMEIFKTAYREGYRDGVEYARNDNARARGRWVYADDIDYSGKGYTECTNCRMRYSWGCYLDVDEFYYCPHCGARMEMEGKE